MNRSSVNREIGVLSLHPSAYLRKSRWLNGIPPLTWDLQFDYVPILHLSEGSWLEFLQAFDNDAWVVVSQGRIFPIKGISWVSTTFVLYITLTLGTLHGDVVHDIHVERCGVS